MTDWNDPAAIKAFEDALVDDLRANGGSPSQGPLAGHPISVVYSTGARSGERRRSILTYSRDGDAYVVAGTAGGSTREPAWVKNLEATPDLDFEIGADTLHGRAEVIREGAERDRLWEAHVRQLPHFADYPAQTGRVIPVVRIVTAA